MATPPFSSALVQALQGRTAWRFEGKIGEVFTPRFFCCTDPNTLGISEGKTPVAHITLSPNPAYVGETVSYDGSASYDPDGSITGYAWTFEGHTPGTGTSASGTLSYASPGVYTIELVVTDGTGLKSHPARVELVVAEPTLDGYVATDSGVFFGSGTPITWVDKNSGLVGSDLAAYDVVIDPATQQAPAANKTVWLATAGGIFVSNDGGATWTAKNPASVSNQWGDSPAPTVAGLVFRALLLVGERLFAAATWQNGSGDYRSWIFYTDDAPSMRSDPSQTVTWIELSTGWDS